MRVLAPLPTFATSVHCSPTMTDALDRSRPGDATADTAGPAPDGATLSSDPSTADPRGEPGSSASMAAAAADGRYRLGAELARGGLGRVLVARDRHLGGREVAVKQLIKATPTAARRFRREALLTARLQHPGIVPLYDLGGGDEPFYAMKLVAGRTLDRLIADARDRRGRLALLPHLIAVAEAVGYAHSQGVIHRDLKPANVLVGDFGETVVVDWGLAKRVRPGDDDGDGDGDGDGSAGGDVVSSELTAAGDVLGTPAYMAPEQAAGDAVDERADVYALGALLYHALSGVRPYQGPTGQSVLVQVAAGPPPPLASRADIAPDLVAIVERAMARDPAHRYRNCGDLGRELRRFQTGQLVEAHAYSRWLLLRRFLGRHRAAVAVAIVLLAATAVSAAVGVVGVVHERNVAAGERDRARRRSEELMIEQARSALGRDPAAAIAWLGELGGAIGEHGHAVAGVVADARARGVARHVVAAHGRAIKAIELSSDSRTMLTASDDGSARLWTLDGDRAPQLRATLGHGAPLTRVAVAADGAVVATATQDGAVVWWDAAAARGEQPATAGQPAWRHRGMVYALRLAGDGRLVTAGDDGAVWAGRRGEVPVRLAQHEGAVYAVAVSARGLVAAGGVDGAVDLIGPDGRRRLDHGAAVVELAFSPDERWLATLCSDGAVRLWPTAGGAPRVLGRTGAAPWDLAFAPAGDRLAVVDRGGGLTVFDVATGAAATRRAHASAALLVRWSADGAWIATGGDDSELRLWGAADGARWTLRGQRGSVQALAVAADGRWLAAGDQDGVVRLWPRPAERYRASALHDGVVRRIAVARSGAVATGGADGAVWLAAPGGAPVRLGAHARSVDGLAIRGDGGLVVSGDTGGELVVRGADGSARPLGRESSAITWLAMAPGGAAVAAATRDGAIGVWDLASGARRGLDGHAGMAIHAVFASDRVLVSGGVDGTVRRWNLADASGEVVVRAPASVYRVAVAPDGATLAAGGDDGTVLVWDATRGAEVVHRHARTVSSVAFAPDGRWLVSASWDQTARVIPLAGGFNVDLVGHGEQVNAALFSPAGDAVVTAGDDGALRVWGLDGHPRRVLRAHDGFVTRLGVGPDGSVVSAGADGALVRWSEPFQPAPAADTEAAIEAISSARIDADRAARTPR
jgi:WD40 repeat protein